MTCDVTLWTHQDVKSQKNGISLKLCIVVALTTKFHDISTVTFPWQHNGLQALSIQKIKSEFSPSRSVICSCCLFSGCELIWTLHSTTTRKSARLEKQIRHLLFCIILCPQCDVTSHLIRINQNLE